jgi:hypothetical protein
MPYLDYVLKLNKEVKDLKSCNYGLQTEMNPTFRHMFSPLFHTKGWDTKIVIYWSILLYLVTQFICFLKLISKRHQTDIGSKHGLVTLTYKSCFKSLIPSIVHDLRIFSKTKVFCWHWGLNSCLLGRHSTTWATPLAPF